MPHTSCASSTISNTRNTTRSLAFDTWSVQESAHFARANTLTAAHRARKQRGEKHPIEDFLFTYYSINPATLARWHAGADVTLEGASDGVNNRAEWKYYAQTDNGAARVDLDAFFAKRGKAVDYIEKLLSATLTRTPQFGCFGLHEWAMVYKMTAEDLRHRGLTLRIGHEATDIVVESNPIGCSHFDAYRFFTPEAEPLNQLRPTRETQADYEQSGCLHAGMDVYKWCGKLGPIIPGELLLDSFELARDIRQVDMQASPYDVSDFGLEAICIETPQGKREYADRQRAFAVRGNALRERTLNAIGVAREVFASGRRGV